MNATRLANGNLLIPKRAEGINGQLGDGFVEITPDDSEYQDWIPFISDKDGALDASTSDNTQVDVRRKENGNRRNKYDERRSQRRKSRLQGND